MTLFPALVRLVLNDSDGYSPQACDLSDEVEVLVKMEHRELCELRGSSDEQIGDRRCSMLAKRSERRLDLNGPIFDLRCEVLDWHRCDRW